MAGIVIKVRNPKPEDLGDAMDEFDGDKGDEKMAEEPDEDADKAGARSAMEDYLKAIGASTKNVDKALEYLKEVIGYCKE